MDIDDLSIGLVVRIIWWEETSDPRPEHWSDEMDEWQDCVVTIADFDGSSEEVWIEDDEGRWQWYPWDFDHYHVLPFSNINMVYKRHKHAKLMEASRIFHKKRKEKSS